MAVLDREEEFRHRLLEDIYREAPDTRRAIELLFTRGLKFVEGSEFLQQLYIEDTYPQLLRKLGKERLEAHQHKDEQELNGFITALQQQGLFIQAKPEAVVGLFRALFLLTLHKREIGENIFDEVMGLTARVVASGLTTNPGHSQDSGTDKGPGTAQDPVKSISPDPGPGHGPANNPGGHMHSDKGDTQ